MAAICPGMCMSVLSAILAMHINLPWSAAHDSACYHLWCCLLHSGASAIALLRMPEQSAPLCNARHLAMLLITACGIASSIECSKTHPGQLSPLCCCKFWPIPAHTCAASCIQPAATALSLLCLVLMLHDIVLHVLQEEMPSGQGHLTLLPLF